MNHALRYDQRDWRSVTVGEALPHVEVDITFRRVVMNPGATLDYFPGHYDVDYARAQGQPTVYVNSMYVMGLVDRLALSWAGPRAVLRRRRMRLRWSLYAGDRAGLAGTVTSIERDEAGGGLAVVEVTVTNQHDVACCDVTVTLLLPGPT